MALFKFLFKDKAAKEKEPAAKPAQTSTGTKTAPAAASTATAKQTAAAAKQTATAAKQTATAKPQTASRFAPPAPKPAPAPVAPPTPRQGTSPSDLDALMSVLQQIEEVIDDGAEAEPQAAARGKSTTVPLRIADMMKFAPSLFDKAVPVGPDEIASVIVDDLYNQLARGKVTTSVQNLLHDVPQQYVPAGAHDKAEAQVAIPLYLIVAALDPVELKKRTSSVQKDFGVDKLPNLFVSQRPKTAAAAPQQKPAASEKPAAAKAPVPETPKAAPEPKPAVAQAPAAPAIEKPAAPPPPAPAEPKAATAPRPAPVEPKAAPAPQPSPAKPVAPAAPVAPPTAPAPAAAAATPAAQPAKPPQPAPAKSVVEPPKTPAAAPLRLKKDAEKQVAPSSATAPIAAEQKPAAPKAPATPPAAVPKPAPAAAPKVEPAPVQKPEQPVAAAPKPTAAPPPQARPTVGPTRVTATPAPTPTATTPKAPVTPAPRPTPAPVAQTPEPAAPIAAAPKEPVAEKPAAPTPPPRLAPGKITDMLLGLGKEAVAPASKPPAAEAPKPAAPAVPIVPAPAPKPAAPAAPPAQESKPTPAPTRVPMPQAAEPKPAPAPVAAATPKTAPAAPVIAGTGRIPPLMHRGIDLNTASAEDILSHVEGIGEAMAEHIVEDRMENGPFYALFDLARVPGVGAKLFEKITGWKWHEDSYGQLNVVNLVLDKWDGGLPDLNAVAERFQALTGFEGCVILHRDGHLLASSWNPKSSQALEAMGPQIVKRTAQYMKSVCPGETMSVTVFMENRVVAFAEHADVIFVGIRSPRAFNRRHLQIVHGMAMALGKRFSGLRDA